MGSVEFDRVDAGARMQSGLAMVGRIHVSLYHHLSLQPRIHELHDDREEKDDERTWKNEGNQRE